MPDNYTNDAESVIACEKQHIKANRKKHAINSDKYTGLALSGGGIRSASFSLGVIQSLVAHDKLTQMDYMSTVSGGGYLGAALSWFLKSKPGAGTEQSNFPLGNKAQQGNKQHNRELDFLRQHGNYLVPGNGISTFSLLAYALRTMFVSLAVYFGLLVVVMFLLKQAGLFNPPNALYDLFNAARNFSAMNWLWIIAACLLGIYILYSFAYSIFTRLSTTKASWRYRHRVFSLKFDGCSLFLILGLLIVGSVVPLYQFLVELQCQYITSMTSTLLGMISGVAQYKQQETKQQSSSSQLVAVLGTALLLYGLLLTAYIVVEALYHQGTTSWVYFAIILVTVVFIGVCVNINFLSLHRFYRDRLMETFLPDELNVQDNNWGLASNADSALIETVCQTPNERPYHLINTNLVLVDSGKNKYRGRGGDNFIVSPLYCGSEATGWRQSSQYMREGRRQGMTLATAMAVSAAALNPAAGVGGRGITRNKLVSTLLSLLNLRLGYWVSNPDPEKHWSYAPNFIYPALKGGVFSSDLKEDRRALQLSDGGHFENLALYELVRRQLSTIVVADAGADETFNFEDLANVVEKVRVDFGVKILFYKAYDLNYLLPVKESDDLDYGKYQLSKRGFAIAKIIYPTASGKAAGKLIYIKSSLIKNLPADLLGYKASNPDFPHESTADQFFDETQFEAYRELGYQLTENFFKANEKQNWI